MSKFWGGLAALILLAVVLLLFEVAPVFDPGGEKVLTVHDLETECRQEVEDAQVSLRNGRMLFTGSFAEKSNRAELDYRYTKTEEKISLNVISKSPISGNRSFLGNCLAQVTYRLETPRLEPGSYRVRVRHNGELSRDTVLSVN